MSYILSLLLYLYLLLKNKNECNITYNFLKVYTRNFEFDSFRSIYVVIICDRLKVIPDEAPKSDRGLYLLCLWSVTTYVTVTNLGCGPRRGACRDGPSADQSQLDSSGLRPFSSTGVQLGLDSTRTSTARYAQTVTILGPHP